MRMIDQVFGLLNEIVRVKGRRAAAMRSLADEVTAGRNGIKELFALAECEEEEKSLLCEILEALGTKEDPPEGG